MCDENDVMKLMVEDPMIEEIRDDCKATIANLQKAMELLNEARDFNYFKESKKTSLQSENSKNKLSLEEEKDESDDIF